MQQESPSHIFEISNSQINHDEINMSINTDQIRKQFEEKNKEINFWKNQVAILQSRLTENANKSSLQNSQIESEQVRIWREKYFGLEGMIENRIKLGIDAERRNMINANQTEKIRYEKQINMMQNQLKEYEYQIQLLIEQSNDKLKQYQEILIHTTAQKTREDFQIKEKEQLSLNLQNALATIRKYEAEMDGLKAQVNYTEKLARNIAEYEIKIKELTSESMTLRTLNQRNEVIENISSRINEYDEKFRQLVNENLKLSIEIDQYKKTLGKYADIEPNLQKYKSKCDDLQTKVILNEKTIAKLNEQIQINGEFVQKYRSESEEWKKKYGQLEEKEIELVKSQEAKIKNLEMDLAKLKSELDANNRKHEFMIFQLKEDHEKAEKTLLNELNEQKSINMNISDQKNLEIQGLASKYNLIQMENDKLKIEINQSQAKIDECMNLIDHFKTELTRAKSKLQDHEKSKSHSAAQHDQEKKSMELEFKRKLDERLKELEIETTGQIIQLRSKLSEYEHKINEYQTKTLLYCIEIERLHQVGSEYYQEIQVLKMTNYRLQNEQKELINNHNILIEIERRRYEGIIQKLKAQAIESEMRIEKLLAENEKLTDIHCAKIKELEAINTNISAKYEERYSATSNKASESDIQEIKLRQESEKREFILQIDKLHQMLVLKTKELEQMKYLSDQRKHELDELNLKYQKSNTGISQEQYTAAVIQIEEMRKTKDLYKYELDSLRKKYNELIEGIKTETFSEKPTNKKTNSPNFIKFDSYEYLK